MKKLLTLVVAMSMGISALTACTTPSPSPTTPAQSGEPTQSAAPVKSAEPAKAELADTLTWAMHADQTTMDPQNNNTNNVVLPNVYQSLLGFAPDGSIVPAMAKTWKVADDKVTWTFNLRDDVLFQNGKKMTSG